MTATRWTAVAMALALVGAGCGDHEAERRPSGRSMQPEPVRTVRGIGREGGGEANRPPQISSVTLSPASPRAGEAVRAIVDASDPDGDRIHLRFAWRIGERRFTAAGGSLEHVRSRKGDAIEVTVTASDDRAESEPFRAATTVRNSPPRILAVQIEPSGFRPGDDVRAEPEAEDRDGDSLAFRYTWRVNGITAPGTEAVFSTAGLKRGDELSVEVSVSDRVDWGESLRSEDVAVGNGIPVIVSEPSPPGADGVFRYRVVAQDPDGDRPLRMSLGDAPAGMTLNPATGLLEWRPRRAQAGRHRVEVVVADPNGGRATQSFQVVVGEAPAAPAP